MPELLLTSVILILQISLTVAANVLLKAGAAAAVLTGSSPLGSLREPATVSGVFCFALSFLLYSMLLRRMPLNIAQCFLALQFVLIIFAAVFVLGEPVPALRWVGVGTITFGIGLVALSL